MFRINNAEFGALKARTFSEVGSSVICAARNSGIVLDLNCGCGAGGSCASSCVSGCSERG